MKRQLAITILGASMFFWSCHTATNSTTENETIEVEIEVDEKVEIVLEKEGIRLSSVDEYTSYPTSALELTSPLDISDTGQMTFEFQVNDYTLGEQTSDTLAQTIANSGAGQHIHVIWDNQPYMAKYEPNASIYVQEGHHVLLAFLARSYHMSVKTNEAHVLQEYTVGEFEDHFDETAPHLFYSRPKGEYVGTQTEKILLDFYLLNTNLTNENYSVRVTINDVVFRLDYWMPYFVEGLPLGENTIQLELVDGNGQRIDSPFNPVERTILLKEE